MINVAVQLHGTTVPCSFPECGYNVPVGRAQVLGFQAIGAIIKRRVGLWDLVVNAFCPHHAKMAAKNQTKLFWFLAAVRQVARAAEEREVAVGFFGQFSAKTSGNGPVDTSHRPRTKRGQRGDGRPANPYDSRSYDS